MSAVKRLVLLCVQGCVSGGESGGPFVEHGGI